MGEKPRTIPWLTAEGPERVKVREGDVWRWLFDVQCRSGRTERRGSLLFVHDRTGHAPHGEIGPNGHNWICRSEDGFISVWATLEQCVERGLLQKEGANA